jgi:hypothetical protein
MSLASIVTLAGGSSSVLLQRPEISDNLANLLIRKFLPKGHHDLFAFCVKDTVLDRLGNGLVGDFRLCLGCRVIRYGKFFPHWSISSARFSMALLAVLHVEFLSACIRQHREGEHSKEGEYQSDFFAHVANYVRRRVKVKTMLERLKP